MKATKGEPGQELALELLLRVVADVGIVGFPNAGKSSLLAAVTRAQPEVAPYPFTTLMPNLGVVDRDPSNPTVLADLPGLIEGAHKGRGLGRAFLRHLRRTRGMVVVVDVSGESPLGDYLAVREELRLYNPDYVLRFAHDNSRNCPTASLSLQLRYVPFRRGAFRLIRTRGRAD